LFFPLALHPRLSAFISGQPFHHEARGSLDPTAFIFLPMKKAGIRFSNPAET
jgi:hypothetical protein